MTRHASTHAAGVVVLASHSPRSSLQRVARGENVIMTQYHMHALQNIGLLKMDFLGLTNLTILETCADAHRGDARRPGSTCKLSRAGDPKTFAMFECRHDRRLPARRIWYAAVSGRTSADDCRPYRRDGRSTAQAHGPHPTTNRRETWPTEITGTPIRCSSREVLKSTYGVIVYQDQVLQIVQAIAGFSLGQADILRRAMGKKIKEEMARETDHFLKGAKKNEVESAVASKIWEYIEPFAGYAFNRAHAYCYAYIAYQTAYLKCNYPHEYMAAMLTTQGDDLPTR